MSRFREWRKETKATPLAMKCMENEYERYRANNNRGRVIARAAEAAERIQDEKEEAERQRRYEAQAKTARIVPNLRPEASQGRAFQVLPVLSVQREHDAGETA